LHNRYLLVALQSKRITVEAGIELNCSAKFIRRKFDRVSASLVPHLFFAKYEASFASSLNCSAGCGEMIVFCHPFPVHTRNETVSASTFWQEHEANPSAYITTINDSEKACSLVLPARVFRACSLMKSFMDAELL
jgi:hypothetical protein